MRIHILFKNALKISSDGLMKMPKTNGGYHTIRFSYYTIWHWNLLFFKRKKFFSEKRALPAYGRFFAKIFNFTFKDYYILIWFFIFQKDYFSSLGIGNLSDSQKFFLLNLSYFVQKIAFIICPTHMIFENNLLNFITQDLG